MRYREGLPDIGIERENEERRDGGCAFVFDPETQKYAVAKHPLTNNLSHLFAGGVDSNEDIEEGVLREVTEESGLNDFKHVEKICEAFVHYHHSVKKINRIAKTTCFLVILESRNNVGHNQEEHEKYDLVWTSAREILDSWLSREEDRRPHHWIHFMSLAVPKAIALGYDKTTNFDELTIPKTQ
jgi:ADP-ribose pyrophosphatase YjhB (NUDIX family)